MQRQTATAVESQPPAPSMTFSNSCRVSVKNGEKLFCAIVTDRAAIVTRRARVEWTVWRGAVRIRWRRGGARGKERVQRDRRIRSSRSARHTSSAATPIVCGSVSRYVRLGITFDSDTDISLHSSTAGPAIATRRAPHSRRRERSSEEQKSRTPHRFGGERACLLTPDLGSVAIDT